MATLRSFDNELQFVKIPQFFLLVGPTLSGVRNFGNDRVVCLYWHLFLHVFLRVTYYGAFCFPQTSVNNNIKIFEKQQPVSLHKSYF